VVIGAAGGPWFLWVALPLGALILGRWITGSLAVRHAGTLAFATVHLNRDGNTTTFRVHGSGLIINRIVNEFGIARKVTEALKESLGSASAG